MIVEVSDQSNRLIATVGTPISSKWPTHYLHWIDICGVRFNPFIGARMPVWLKEPCAFRPGQKRLLVAKQQERTMANDYRLFWEAIVKAQ